MEFTNAQHIENIIFTLRGEQVMLDFHLANLYGVETKRLNEQVKRNPLRFPKTFMFQITTEEWESLRSQFATTEQNLLLQSQFATSKRRTLPYVFTEQGVAMLSAVLNSDLAIEASIKIMQAFINMRKFLLQNATVFQRLNQLELKQLQTDEKIERVFKALEAGQPQPNKGIYFDGQIFDAYSFISELIKKAEKEIILIDNYVDESVLTLLSKRGKQVNAIIYTKEISKTVKLDLQKHNAQYPPILVKSFALSHDRFLIIDKTELYHIGASLKDLGKKWFAFSRMD
ncbi:MAG: ORF6N domain-containing protein, partial [Sphingobacteriia bacterium]|nr:ORF6N domain-containing protein [Sphingobacteriia bacterium]